MSLLWFADLRFDTVKKFPSADASSEVMQLIELIADTAEWAGMRVRWRSWVVRNLPRPVCRMGEKMILNA